MAATITTREVAAAHHITLRTAQRWAQTGRLDAVKVAGRWVITIPANLDQYKPAQVDRARELIEQGGILATSRPGIYTAVSSDGTVTYLVAEEACSCPAGLRGKHVCYHRAAVALLNAAKNARRAA
jgi:hypothetical protein